ncbi:MAG: 4-hydroxy-tetrahydrodipicolinate reductase [Chlamydiales bacterium]|nr:4-hydroxy-tetrahydrodipicolinate reductase [Chlamydiales bacterium]
MALRISVLGALGKMGKKIIELAKKNPDFCIASGYTHRFENKPAHLFCYEESSSSILLMPTAEEAIANSDVTIDFSSMQATQGHILAAQKHKKPLVIGTTGLERETLDLIEKASYEIPILHASNFSLGIAICLKMIKHLDARLYQEAQIQILETHHIHKKDSPSGTAIALASTLQTAKRPQIQSIRSGDAIGEHTLLFEWEGEKILLTHQALDREIFAKGALLAAEFIARQPPGLYTMENI